MYARLCGRVRPARNLFGPIQCSRASTGTECIPLLCLCYYALDCSICILVFVSWFSPLLYDALCVSPSPFFASYARYFCRTCVHADAFSNQCLLFFRLIVHSTVLAGCFDDLPPASPPKRPKYIPLSPEPLTLYGPFTSFSPFSLLPINTPSFLTPINH